MTPARTAVYSAANWAERVVRFFSNPVVAPFLLTLGFLGLITEIKTPAFGMAGVAGLLNRRHDGRSIGCGQKNALGTVGNAGFDCRHLGFMVAVDLAGEGLQLDAEFFRLGGRAFLHLHEERIWCPSW